MSGAVGGLEFLEGESTSGPRDGCFTALTAPAAVFTSRRKLGCLTISTAAMALSLAFGLVAAGALVAQLGEIGLAQRSEWETNPEAEIPFCEHGRLQDAYRMNLDKSSDRFGQCAQICLSPSLKGVAANHGVLFGSRCPQLGCRDRLDETEKSGQRVIFFACPRDGVSRRQERRTRDDEPAPLVAKPPPTAPAQSASAPTPPPIRQQDARASSSSLQDAQRSNAEPPARAASEPFLPERSQALTLRAGNSTSEAAQTRRAFRAKLLQGHH